MALWRRKAEFRQLPIKQLQAIAKKLYDEVSDDCSDRSDRKICLPESVAKRPPQSTAAPQAGALEFSHQEVGIEQKKMNAISTNALHMPFFIGQDHRSICSHPELGRRISSTHSARRGVQTEKSANHSRHLSSSRL